MSTLEHAAGLHDELVSRGATVASAESLTGGAVADVLSTAPGASRSFLGGVVSYATEVKVKVLGVSQQTVDDHGVVSRECAREMAQGVRRLLGSDLGVSTTGVAGPETQEGKPVGLVYVAVATRESTEVVELHLDGDRAAVRRQSVEAAVAALMATVGAEPDRSAPDDG